MTREAAPVEAAPPRVEPLPPVQRVAEVAAPASIRPPVGQAMPGNLAAFVDWLGQDFQPEAAWHGPLFLPPVQEHARLLVLCEMPDDGADEGGLPFTMPAARLVTAMLAAIGLDAGAIGFAPLATRRPPGGHLDESTFDTLAGRTRHYLALVRPQAVLILGDRTSRALVAAQDGGAVKGLPEIHHAGGIVPAAAFAGPELLMRRPIAKAASWQTLRLLHGILNA
ncbi:MAG: uracil-DNA glycosylase [Sphingobium sp.]|nr:uracil-DNA glycosylase [Sphingobium sp.]